MNKISKELLKIAKLLKAEIQVDQTQHTIDQLCMWIKNGFKDKTRIVLNKLNLERDQINYFIKKAHYKKVYNNWDGVYFLNGKSNIEFRKTFVIPFDDSFSDIVEQTAQDSDIFVQVTNYQNKQLCFSFKLTLKANDWYPLFRSCEQLNYDEKGNFDKDSLKHLEDKLEECFEQLKF